MKLELSVCISLFLVLVMLMIALLLSTLTGKIYLSHLIHILLSCYIHIHFIENFVVNSNKLIRTRF